jgi:hypothetical protein
MQNQRRRNSETRNNRKVVQGGNNLIEDFLLWAIFHPGSDPTFFPIHRLHATD